MADLSTRQLHNISLVRENWILLNERERQVIYLLYGMDQFPNKPRTLDETGKLLVNYANDFPTSLTRERVRQIEHAVLSKIERLNND